MSRNMSPVTLWLYIDVLTLIKLQTEGLSAIDIAPIMNELLQDVEGVDQAEYLGITEQFQKTAFLLTLNA